MTIITADDEPLALEMLTDLVKSVKPEAEVVSFSRPQKIIEWLKSNKADVAFLDIRMRGMTGLEVAEKIKEVHPETNIIFVTGYDEYALPAMSLHASGYVMKPVSEEKIKKELEQLRFPVNDANSTLLTARCFGNFDVFDTKEAAQKAMNNWRESLLEHGDETIKIAEESFDDDDRDQVEERIREWTMEWDSPTYELHFSQVIHEFVKVDGKYIKVSHA